MKFTQMKIKITVILFCIVLCILFTKSSTAQALTVDDFKINLDNYIPEHQKGNTIRITKDQLLAAKQLQTNFSWATIQSATYYFYSTTSTDALPIGCKGNLLCPQLKVLFKRCGPGSIITIVPVVVNKKQTLVNWGSLTISIK